MLSLGQIKLTLFIIPLLKIIPPCIYCFQREQEVKSEWPRKTDYYKVGAWSGSLVKEGSSMSDRVQSEESG